MKDIIFYQPSYTFGGAELLFIRCAKFLAQTNTYNVSYIDYYDGILHTQLKDEHNIFFICYKEKLKLKPSSLIVIELAKITEVESTFSTPEDFFYLFWSIHPDSIVGKIIISQRFRHFHTMKEKQKREVGEILKELSNRRIISYMDYNNYYASSNTFKFNVKYPSFIPIPIDERDIIRKPELIEHIITKDRVITFMWIGRLDRDKVNTLCSFINELEYFNQIRTVKLLVVGTGKRVQQIKSHLKKVHYEIELLGKVTGKELLKIIDEQADIGIGMGTSVLDFAKRGKPAIVQGFLHKIYKPNLLHDYVSVDELDGYDLVSPGYRNTYGKTFTSIVMVILESYNKTIRKGIIHIEENHTISATGSRLIEVIESVLTSDKKETYFKVSYLSDIFSRKRWPLTTLLLRTLSNLSKRKHI